MTDITRLLELYYDLFADGSEPEPFNNEDLQQVEYLSNRSSDGIKLALAAGYMKGYEDAGRVQYHHGCPARRLEGVSCPCKVKLDKLYLFYHKCHRTPHRRLERLKGWKMQKGSVRT